MEFGFSIPPRGPMATPENIARLAQQGEAMGFGIIAVTDHIIFPKSIQSTYPGSVSGQYYAAGDSQGEYWSRWRCWASSRASRPRQNCSQPSWSYRTVHPSLPVAARNDVRPDAQQSVIFGAHYLRRMEPFDAQ
jgi:hypothetical protein